MTASRAARRVRRLFANASSPRPNLPPICRPTLERLEDRLTPSTVAATFGVQTVGYTGLPYYEITADVNGDGRPDIIDFNYENGLDVRFNTTPAGGAAPSFSAPVGYGLGLGGYLEAVSVGDFNGDGKLDLAVGLLTITQQGANNYSLDILLNTTQAGDSTFTYVAQTPITLNFRPFSLTAADFNGDGRPDLVVAGANPTTSSDTGQTTYTPYASVLLNQTADGAGTTQFGAPTSLEVGFANQIVHSVVAADFNGDGRPDIALVMSNQGNSGPNQARTGPDAVSVFLNTAAAGAGLPSFTAQQTFAVGHGADGLAVGDFNGDGRPDLAVVNDGDGTASVLLDLTPAGYGSASFTNQQTYSVGAAPTAAYVAVGDFNGDGKPDLAFCNYNDGTVSILQNETAQPTYGLLGSISTASQFAAAATVYSGGTYSNVTVGDFNGDSRPDLVVTPYFTGYFDVLVNNTLVPSPSSSGDLTPFDAAPAAVADFTGYGVQVFNRILNNGVWLQLPALPASGTPTTHTPDAALLATDASGYIAADFTGLGVWRYAPATGVWTMINGQDAEALAVDGAGDLFASFAGAGIGKFRLDGTSRFLTPAAATLLSADATGDVIGEFQGYGVWRLRPYDARWLQVNGGDAEAISLDGRGDAFVSIAGAGVGEFRLDFDNTLVSSAGAAALAADAYGAAALAYPATGSPRGVQEYYPSNPSLVPQLPAKTALLGMADNGDIFADFTGQGVWEYDPFNGWEQLISGNNTDPALLVVG